MKKSIVNDLSKSLKNRRWYNPNSYTALDATICFFVTMLLFFIYDNVIGYLVIFIRDNLTNDYYFISTVMLAISQGSIFIIAFIFSKIKKVSLFSGGGYRYKFEIVDILFAVLLTLGIYCVFNATHYAFTNDIFYSYYGESFESILGTNDAYDYSNNFFLLLYVYILTPILPAICEEVLFRGVILRGYSNKGPLFCIIASSVIFALMHGNFQQVILQFIGGLAICIVVYITKNFMIGAIMHFTNNFCVQILYVFQMNYLLKAPYADLFIDAFYIIFGIIFLIISVIYFGKKLLNNQKLAIQNKKPFDNYKNTVACISTKLECHEKYKTIKMNDVDFSKLSSDSETVFLYKGKFYTVNNSKNKILEIILFIFGAIFTILCLVMSL